MSEINFVILLLAVVCHFGFFLTIADIFDIFVVAGSWFGFCRFLLEHCCRLDDGHRSGGRCVRRRTGTFS